MATPASVVDKIEGIPVVWILQEFILKDNDDIEILLELPMPDQDPVRTLCQDRLRELYDKRYFIDGVRALNSQGEELFRWTWFDERFRRSRPLERLLKLAREEFH